MKHKHPTPRALARTSLVLAASLTLCAGLSGCGHSDSADGVASSDTVEMPAEEALSGIVATPAADPSATATDSSMTGATPAADRAAMLPAAASAAPPVSTGPVAKGEPDKD